MNPTIWRGAGQKRYEKEKDIPAKIPETGTSCIIKDFNIPTTNGKAPLLQATKLPSQKFSIYLYSDW
jgi:hypothetical protein